MLDGTQLQDAPSAAGKGNPYPPPSQTLSQEGERGIRFDFNQGARVSFPARTEGHWRVCLSDLDTGNILFRSENQGALVASTKQYFVRFGLEVWDVDDKGVATPVFAHKFDARGKHVIVQFPDRHARRHHWLVQLCGALWRAAWMPTNLRDVWPDHPVVRDGLSGHQLRNSRGDGRAGFACSIICHIFARAVLRRRRVHSAADGLSPVGLHRTAGYILGVDPRGGRPRLELPDESRPIEEPYVCIAVQSSTQCKYWNNPRGWLDLIKFLKRSGYRVICIDQKPVHGNGILWNQIPHGAEDETGDRPLVERARWLRHAAAFIGVSSGLSWLAWAAGCPVVLISGFTHPTNEFETPYRVINWHACNSCWNDPTVRFKHDDFAWCPRHKGTDRQFECSRLITPEQVIATVKQSPAFQPTSLQSERPS